MQKKKYCSIVNVKKYGLANHVAVFYFTSELFLSGQVGHLSSVNKHVFYQTDGWVAAQAWQEHDCSQTLTKKCFFFFLLFQFVDFLHIQ